ncbi:putative baseplate protein [Pseudomonas phage ventosus]|uniref:Putative baseplate protein n=1 Tax=Pseudomonas phage ventosus TaxID=2048980 RepID=A0A2H4P865_9CAUD|nr:putative baseplate protein [Pseudomonas phage ventosus]
MIEALMADYINTQFQINMSEVYTALPCVVTNVVGSFENQRVDVQPAINTLYKDGTSEEHTQILGVPVLLPGSSTSMVSFPIQVGDTVMCVFSQRSMDNFKIGNGQPTVPNDYRKFSDQDAVAIPGLFSFAKSANRPAIRKYPHNPKTDLVIAHNIASGTEVMIQLKQNGDMIINTEFNVEVNCKTGTINATESYTINTPQLNINADSTTWAGNITHTGNYTQTGTSTFNGIVFDTHKHLGVTPGNGTTGLPTA